MKPTRIIYTPKASKSERNMGCEGLEEKNWKLQGRVGIEGRQRLDGGKAPLKCGGKNQNNHPTVKPLKLMEYLCTLTKTPSGGIVLDPFLGSGTTAMAAKKTGRTYIGIEQDKDYCKIAEARIKAVKVENKLPKYEITWIDINHSTDWIPFNDVDKKIASAETPMTNIGYFLKETQNSYVFSTGIDNEEKQYFDLIVFPKKVVQKIKLIK